ncbi:hypothetical protein NliqN6_4504 [Naganishia liquefaciens]|uniref:t-SNARE coiled-coil homology domain-containing protein n=1 Tax=Naganishia liquefaciens TaxID=104408 RepID=A0A8H3TVY0_9TREE|nr:hypothetical protein NliqN6_4504 [Naganishia liquefaciens]
MYIDQTSIFRTIVSDKLGHDPTSGGHGASSSAITSSEESSRAVSPTGIRHRFAGKRDGLKRRRRNASREEEDEERARRDFLAEAYRIHNQLSELTAHLRLIRRAYLSTAPSPLSSRHRPPQPPTPDDDPERARLRYLERSKHLSDREKDEVDVRARLVIKTCRDRVELLEQREKLRQSRAPTTSSTASSLISHFLPSLQALTSSETTLTPQQRSSILAAHHGAVIWFLNAELLGISERQREMQEERGRIRDERGKSLGGMVAKEVVSANGDAQGASAPLNLTIPYKPSKAFDPAAADDDAALDASLDLTPSQIQQFSSENTDLLESMQTTLNTVLQAERSLLEISQLQTTLISHLASQTETIERLYDDANDAIGSVEQANAQLREAKQSGRDARFFLLVFLIGASMALLFLDWYSS